LALFLNWATGKAAIFFLPGNPTAQMPQAASVPRTYCVTLRIDEARGLVLPVKNRSPQRRHRSNPGKYEWLPDFDARLRLLMRDCGRAAQHLERESAGPAVASVPDETTSASHYFIMLATDHLCEQLLARFGSQVTADPNFYQK
jgi:hypothetical protein